jgi:DNA invertase Pin-like site-specific DNA recombinase
MSPRTTRAGTGTAAGTRVACYTRVAADDPTGAAVQAQERILRDHVTAQLGWRPVAHYHDSGSGNALNRPGLNHALADAEAGRFDVLLVTGIERLARRTDALAAVIDRFDRAGVTVRAADEALDTSTPAGRVRATVLAWVGEYCRQHGIRP